MTEEKEEIIRKYALRNAVRHDGEASVGPVMSKVMGECEECRDDPQGTKELIEGIVEEVNQIAIEDQKEELEELMPEFFEESEEEEDQLPDIEGEEVVMRMAPYPSGPLHIGNSRMVILNDEYVKRNDGKLILFFDDTIGSKEKKLQHYAYDMIKDGLDWLGVDYHEVYYKSDRMDIYYEYAEKILEKGEAYICECSAERLQKNRREGEECPHRSQSVEKNLKMWQAMLDGAYEEGEAVMRIKTDMQHPNPAFRDRVLFRICNREHPRVANKYHVWPLLEFSWAIDDHLLGMTHILRGKDLVMEDQMEEHIWDIFDWDAPEFLHYGMLRLKDVHLSKSEFQEKIRTGEMSGWNDPRTWSLQSLRRRGIQPEALRDFILGFGMSKTDIEVPASKLYAENRKMIDSKANRYFFVPEPVKITLEGDIELDEVEVPRHPDHEERGNRKIKTAREVLIPKKEWEEKQGEEIRLKNFCNIKLDGKKGVITGSGRRDLIKIQWLPEGLDAEVEMPDSTVVTGKVEKGMSSVSEEELIQFERFGFVKVQGKEPVFACYAHS